MLATWCKNGLERYIAFIFIFFLVVALRPYAMLPRHEVPTMRLDMIKTHDTIVLGFFSPEHLFRPAEYVATLESGGPGR